MPTTLACRHKQSNAVLSMCEFFINITRYRWRKSPERERDVRERMCNNNVVNSSLIQAFCWMPCNTCIDLRCKVQWFHECVRYKPGWRWGALFDGLSIVLFCIFSDLNQITGSPPTVNSIWLQVSSDLTHLMTMHIQLRPVARGDDGLWDWQQGVHLRPRSSPAGATWRCV